MSSGLFFFFPTCDFCLFWLHQLSHHGENVLSSLQSIPKWWINCKVFTPVKLFYNVMLHQETRTCGLAFAISRSCSVTSWTISFFLWTSPLGRGTYSSASRSNSVAKVSQRPCLCRNTATEESFLSKSQRNDTRFLTNVNCHWTTTQPRESTGARRPSRCLTEPGASSNTESRPGDERVRGAAVNSNKSVSSSSPDRSRPAPPAHLYWLKEPSTWPVNVGHVKGCCGRLWAR